jgi:hypothetical protein
MANLDISDPTGVVDVRRGRGATGANTLAEIANTTSVSAMRTRLAALDAGYFTAARLDLMNKNDMLYALRVRSADSAGIK